MKNKLNQAGIAGKSVIVLLAVLVFVLGTVAYIFSSGILTSPIKYEKQIAEVEKMSESDSLSDIEKDLYNTDFDNLDFELSEIQAELDQ